MSFKFSCPSCGNKVDLSPADPIDEKTGRFACSSCGAVVTWDEHRRKLWWLVIIVLIAVANFSSNVVVVLGFGGSESAANWIGFGLSVVLVAGYLKWSHRLIVVKSSSSQIES